MSTQPRPPVDARWRDLALQLRDALTQARDALENPYVPYGLRREITGAITDTETLASLERV